VVVDGNSRVAEPHGGFFEGAHSLLTMNPAKADNLFEVVEGLPASQG
jgi:hypothetical protein